MKLKSKFKCEYDLNGECQLYSMLCKDADMCNLKKKCLMCMFMMRSREEEPCVHCTKGGK